MTKTTTNQQTRIYLDDINQCWSSLDTKTGIIRSNSYENDLINQLSEVSETSGIAQEYWTKNGTRGVLNEY